jgi:hypothetical protein
MPSGPNSLSERGVKKMRRQALLPVQSYRDLSMLLREPLVFTSTEVVYGVTGTGVTRLPERGASP